MNQSLLLHAPLLQQGALYSINKVICACAVCIELPPTGKDGGDHRRGAEKGNVLKC